MAQRKQEKRNYGEEELTHTVHVDADIFSELHKSLAESGEEGQSNGAAAIQNSQSVAFTNSMESNKGIWDISLILLLSVARTTAVVFSSH